jgi:hypothetical protein
MDVRRALGKQSLPIFHIALGNFIRTERRLADDAGGGMRDWRHFVKHAWVGYCHYYRYIRPLLTVMTVGDPGSFGFWRLLSESSRRARSSQFMGAPADFGVDAVAQRSAPAARTGTAGGLAAQPAFPLKPIECGLCCLICGQTAPLLLADIAQREAICQRARL